jgi:hypothetical protein
VISDDNKGERFLLLRGTGDEEQGKKKQKNKSACGFTRTIHGFFIGDLMICVNCPAIPTSGIYHLISNS